MLSALQRYREAAGSTFHPLSEACGALVDSCSTCCALAGGGTRRPGPSGSRTKRPGRRKRKRTKLSGALRGPCAEVRGLGALGALEIVPPSKQSEGLTSAHVPAQLICEPGASALCSRFAARSSPSASSSSSPKAVRIVQPQPVHVVPNLWTCQWPWGTIEFVSAKAVSAHATETVKAGTRVLQNSCDIASAIVRLCARPSSTACRTRGMNC